MARLPSFLTRRRQVHLAIAALLVLGLVVFEIARSDKPADMNLIPAGPAARGNSTGSASERAREIGLATKLPPGLPSSAGATHYVSVDGDDEGPGTSVEPWRTVQHALETVGAGEQVTVRGGTYVEDLVMPRAGSADAPITISAEADETVTLRPASTEGDTYAVRFTDAAAFLRFQGFVIEGASGVSSTNVYFEGSVHDIELSHNEIRFSQDQGVFAERTTHGLAIENNRVHDNGRGHVPGQHQSHGMYIEGRGHIIANNLVYDHPEGFGIQLYPALTDTVVVNNTIVRSGHSGIVIGGADGVSGLIVRNNIVASNEDYGIAMDDTCPTDSVVDTNLASRNDGGGIEGGCDGVDTSGDNFRGDPLFVDPERHRFDLRSRSPATDRARAPWAPRTDLRDRLRPFGPGADIGAYEGSIETAP